MHYVIIASVIIIIVFVLLGIGLALFSLTIRRQSIEEARQWQQEHYDISWYDAMDKVNYTVASYDGYLLHVQLLKNTVPSDKYVIISHGYTDNHIGSLKYTDTYLNLGYNVILYDLRGHGENEKTFCTYTIREAKDLVTLINDTRERYSDFKTLGIHGESLGAATSIACLKYNPDIAFVVADCGFSEIKSVMENGLASVHLPRSFIKWARFWAKIIYGYNYDEMRPIDSLSNNEVPICFIHGAADNFIFPFHSENMAKATRGYSELHLIDQATHAASVLTDKPQYHDILENFLSNVTH